MSAAPPLDANKKAYDIILFGVTGFTGKLAAEYILTHYHDKVTWAVSARNEAKARQTLTDIAASLGSAAKGGAGAAEEDAAAAEVALPKILPADLACSSDDDVDRLRQVVRQTRLVLTTAGPFHAYGKTLLRLCAELGVHYCDITGETNFVRDAIVSSDAVARSTGAVIVPHCGNDCIPNDLLTYEIHLYAKQRFGADAYLHNITVINEVGDGAELSGGTAATAIYNLSPTSAPNAATPKPDFDPLLMTAGGNKSDCSTKNVTPKHTVTTDLGSASPWIMGPVMVNCIRRSNALLQYSKSLECSDLLLESKSWSSWFRSQTQRALLAAAMALPPLQALLPAPGEGPSREQLERGFLTLHGRATVRCPAAAAAETDAAEAEVERAVVGTFHFGKDTGYLYTAAMLVETGLLLLERTAGINKPPGGVWTPASALGHDLTVRLLDRLDAMIEVRAEDGDGGAANPGAPSKTGYEC